MFDSELHGGWRGYISHLHARITCAFGAYGAFAEIDWDSVERLVFVCKGNICRSPYAAARARSLGIRSISVGLDAAEGASADPTAARNAFLRGVDLSAHRSSKFDTARVEDTDLLVVFEPRHLAAARQRCADAQLVLTLLGIWTSPHRPYIHDPYGLSDRYFQECFSVIDTNVWALTGRLGKAARYTVPERAGGT